MAEETVRILERGEYVAPSGRTVQMDEQVARAVQGTVLYRPGEPSAPQGPGSGRAPPRIEVTDEKTGQAARRLVEEEGVAEVLALNFASAKNPGGGFLGGARAQEEDLARCSALYPCLLAQPDYYTVNRAEPSLLYTDHLIYSPQVPFFRDERGDLLERPFLVSLLTAPAPNAGEALRRDPGEGPRIQETLRRRALSVLRVAAHQGQKTLVLGAWGCGVFRNDPHAVAEAFAQALEALAGHFERVVFAVYEPRGQGPNLRAFRERWG